MILMEIDMINTNIFLFSVDNEEFFVEIPEIYSYKVIPQNIINQLDVAYLEYGNNCIKKYKSFFEVTQLIIKFNQRKLKQIFYKDFDSAVNFHHHDFSDFLKNI